MKANRSYKKIGTLIHRGKGRSKRYEMKTVRRTIGFLFSAPDIHHDKATDIHFVKTLFFQVTLKRKFSLKTQNRFLYDYHTFSIH